MLVTLAETKRALNIASADTSEDTALGDLIGEASQIVRDYLNWGFLGGVIDTISAASPAVCTSYRHLLESGDTINISYSDSGVTIDGSQTATVTDGSDPLNKFSVAVDNSSGSGGSAGTYATYAKTFTEYYTGDETELLFLRNRPVRSITSINVDNAGYYGDGTSTPFGDSDLTEGDDYVLVQDSSNTAVSTTGIVKRISARWHAPQRRKEGNLVGQYGGFLGNIKVVYVAGFEKIPAPIVAAVKRVVAQMRRNSQQGQALASENFDYYSYTLATGENTEFASVARMLAGYKSSKW